MTNDSHTQQTLRDIVRDYYKDNALPEVTLRRLMADPRSRTRSARRWVITGAIAATLAVMALGLGVTGRKLFPPTGAGASTLATPKLVAVQIHADWCARSPRVAPIFAELLTEYGNEPVLFVTLDITDDVRREQAKLLSSTLGISQAFEEPFQSGMIKLIDREHNTVLAAITGRDEAGEFEARIVEALDVIDESQRVGGGGGV